MFRFTVLVKFTNTGNYLPTDALTLENLRTLQIVEL
jgi:hypothetical protein